jgi:hypothetical protein
MSQTKNKTKNKRELLRYLRTMGTRNNKVIKIETQKLLAVPMVHQMKSTHQADYLFHLL